MTDLVSLQDAFMNCVLSGSHDMRGKIVDTSFASAEQRVGVYVDAYRLRLIEVLQKDFPGLHGLLGDEQFDDLARTYVDSHQSHHPSLRWFGQYMAEWLAASNIYAEQPVLAEMAAFEWTQSLTFDSADAVAVSMEDAASIPAERWSTMKIIPHPAIHILRLCWNVAPIWSALDQQKTPPAPERSIEAVDWVFWRHNLQVHWRSLSIEEASAWNSMTQGTTFGKLCEQFAGYYPPETAAVQAAGLLKRWLADGFITHLRTDD